VNRIPLVIGPGPEHMGDAGQILASSY